MNYSEIIGNIYEFGFGGVKIGHRYEGVELLPFMLLRVKERRKGRLIYYFRLLKDSQTTKRKRGYIFKLKKIGW